MKEDFRLVEIQLSEENSKIIDALMDSRDEEKNINNIEILLYLGKGKKPLKIILRPKNDSLDFDVTTPLQDKGKEEIYIGRAQISKALPIGIQTESANLTDLYSISIKPVVNSTTFTESFIRKIKVLKDELGVAKETLRLTGDIPTRELCDRRERKSSNTISNKIDSSLCQKEDNPLILYLDVPVAKSILLSKALDSLKEWKKILSIKPISIPFSGDLKIGHVSSFVYRAHSPKSGDCTYEVAAKCEINNTAAKEIISKFSINPNLLGPTIRASITKSLEKAYHDYATEKRIMEPYPHPIRYTDCFINESINKHIDKTVMIFVTNFLDIHDYTNIINGSSNYSVNLQIENMIFQGEVFCAEIEGVDPRSRKLKNEDRYIPRVLLRVRVSNNCKNAIISMRKSQGTIHSSIGKLVKKEMFSSETKLVGTVFMHKTSFMDC